MAQATASSTTVKDATGVTKTLSQMADPNNSSYLAPRVVLDEGMITKGTYSTGASLFTLPATPTDVVEIKGSASKTVRIKKIVVSGQATTAKQWPLSLIRRAAAITGGTPVTPVITKFDTSDAAATAVVSHFTALGTLAAANPASSVLFVHDLTLTAPATAAQPIVFDFSTRVDKAIVLRGAADCLVINLGGGALTAGEKLTYCCEWEEDAS